MKKLLLLHNDFKDYITEDLLEEKNLVVGFNIAQLKDLNINDMIDIKKTSINWNWKDGQREYHVSNNNDWTLWSRIQSLPHNLVSDFCIEDQGYAIKEFYSYLQFATKMFPDAISQASYYGLSGSIAPLHVQWKMIRKLQLEIPCLKTPNYYLGSQINLPQDFNVSINTVYTDPFEFFCWRPNQLLKNEKMELQNIFALERPRGTPVISIYVCGQTFFSESDLNLELTEIQRKLINSINQKIKIFSMTEVFETLMFINQDEITFGCWNVNPRHSEFKKPQLRNKIKEQILARISVDK